MIYLLYGTNGQAARTKLHAMLDSLFKKRPDATYIYVTDETPFSLEELTYSQGLFEQKHIVVFDNVFADKERREELLSALKELAASEHAFLFLEGGLDKKTVSKFEKHAERVQEFAATERKRARFNVFALTDALSERNRKKLWLLYQEAKQHDVSDEEIHGILFWQVKNVLVAHDAGSVKDSGLNPFVYKKSLGALRNYTLDEMKRLSRTLVSLSHDARRGMHEFDTALERFILAI